MRKMSKAELDELVQDLTFIRNVFPLSPNARKRIADACNVIDDNIDVLAEESEKRQRR